MSSESVGMGAPSPAYSGEYRERAAGTLTNQLSLFVVRPITFSQYAEQVMRLRDDLQGIRPCERVWPSERYL